MNDFSVLEKTKILNKVFQMEIPEEIYEEIKKYL